MGETATVSSQNLAALPTRDTSFDLPGPWRLWIARGDPHAGLILAASPLVFFGAMFLMVVLADVLESFVVVGLFLLILYAIILLALMSVSSLAGRRTRNRLVCEATQRHSPRLQSAKDWFIRGDISEAEYQELRDMIEPATAAKTGSIQTAKTASMARCLTILLAIGAMVLVPVNMVALVEFLFEGDDGTMFIMLALVIADATTLLLCISSWRVGRKAHAAATILQEQTTQRIELLEDDILRAARGRKVGGGSAYTTPQAAGPSFRAYRGR